uniref:Single-stranded-DNA-specific exonuclease RecJ n=1 Tax=Nitratidesulfovibrio vulgaris (strain DSM 19637 / Miyazaki F) TaxID=883 RepID=B8DKC6_NITV9
MTRDWIFRPEPVAASPPFAAWAERLEVSELIVRLLWRRGVGSVDDMALYLSPNLRHLAPLAEWPGLEQAASTLADGLLAGLPFAVWGDYDVDGVTSTALVKGVLAQHGMAAAHHIPDRREEGYGLNVAWVERLAEQGVRLLLTVDCGISDVEPVRRARELGMTVVVSDHHMPPEGLPDANAICNPRLAECPCPALAGVGVSFLVMAAVNAALAERTGKKADMRDFLDLVALGTLADVVNLHGQNRILVKNGLLKIAEARRPGMAALKTVSGYNPTAAIGAGQVVFGLAPRINAAGRMGKAELALQLLLTDDHAEAARLAQELDAENARRRAEEDRILDAAKKQAEGQLDRMGLVLHGDDWHPGVIGIVASRIVDEFYRPTLILSSDGQSMKGSGRSVAEFDLHAGLTRCADLFTAFGGHHQAAGMSMPASHVDTLRERFDAVVRAELGDTPLTPRLKLDGELGFALAGDFTLLKELEMLQPFGTGNAEPVFASPPVLVRDLRRFGPTRDHVELQLTDESCGITLRAKAWRQSGQFPDSLRGTRVRLAYTPRIDRYNGAASVDLRIKDWKRE